MGSKRKILREELKTRSGDNAFKEFHCKGDRELGKSWRRQWGQECFYNMGGITSVFINGNYHVEKEN